MLTMLKYEECAVNFKNYCYFFAGTFVGVGAATLAPIASDDVYDRKEVEIKIPDATIQQFEQGQGNPADLYKLFAEKADVIITAGGQGATIEIVAGEDVTKIKHTPAAAFVVENAKLGL